ncbi:MAG: hypothetical protein J0L74_14465 [Burkholderiales bacterium]|nr:hypothetical protein [Burkholderiales bacterium]
MSVAPASPHVLIPDAVLALPAGIPPRRLVRPPVPAAPYDPAVTNPVGPGRRP